MPPEVATDPQTGVNLAALAQLLAGQKVAACWFMPSLQNPLGALMPPARKQARGAGELKIIAAILQRAAIGKILTHLGLDPRPPPPGRASGAGHAFAAD
jgi:hypothetical protein